EVERSPDGTTWNVLANVSPRSSHDYSYTDASPQNGKNYYRIKAVDLDGKLTYTAIKSVTIAGETRLTAWPNPASDILFVNIVTPNESQAVIRIFDIKGALVKLQKATAMQGSNQLRIDIGSLPGGVYTLNAEWNNGQFRKAMQVIKQ